MTATKRRWRGRWSAPYIIICILPLAPSRLEMPVNEHFSDIWIFRIFHSHSLSAYQTIMNMVY